MKLKNIGGTLGAIYGLSFLVVGFILQLWSDGLISEGYKTGAGIVLLIGWISYGISYLIILTGALITGITFISWFLATIYSVLSPQGKRYAQWGFGLVLISLISIIAIQSYLYSQAEAQRELDRIAQREERAINKAMQKEARIKTIEEQAIKAANDKKIAAEQCQQQEDLMIGKWTIGILNNQFAEYQNNNVMKYSDSTGWKSTGHWNIDCRAQSSGRYQIYENIQTCPNCAKTNFNYKVISVTNDTLVINNTYLSKNNITLTRIDQ